MLPSLRLGITLFPGVDSGELFTLQGSILKPGQTPELCGSQGSRVSPLGCSVSHSGAKLLVTPAAVYRLTWQPENQLRVACPEAWVKLKAK